MILADFHLPRALRPAVAGVVRIACPPDVEPRGLVDAVALMIEHAIRVYPAGVRSALVVGLAGFEAGAVLRYGRPFSRLDDARARAWWRAWWGSPIGPARQLARTLKMLAAIAYYDTPAVKEALAYRPDAWIAAVARRRLEKWGVAVQQAEEDILAPDPLVPFGRKRQHA
jgi:hypothetical protein